jgi:hypothetical protein
VPTARAPGAGEADCAPTGLNKLRSADEEGPGRLRATLKAPSAPSHDGLREGERIAVVRAASVGHHPDVLASKSSYSVEAERDSPGTLTQLLGQHDARCHDVGRGEQEAIQRIVGVKFVKLATEFDAPFE